MDEARAESLRRERESLLAQIHGRFDGLLIVLSAAWVALLVAELVTGLPRSLEVAVWVIWGIFVADFLIQFTIAPEKLRYLRRQWLTALSLVLPAFRLLRLAAGLRFLYTLRVVRTVGLLRVLTSVNRGLASLSATATRRGVAYVVTATVLIIVVGAAGMAYFETPGSLTAPGEAPDPSTPLQHYADALWWTAYTMTTGGQRQPVTGEGRVLGWLLSLYGLGVFGYLTATLASHFVGRDRVTVSSETGPKVSASVRPGQPDAPPDEPERTGRPPTGDD